VDVGSVAGLGSLRKPSSILFKAVKIGEDITSSACAFGCSKYNGAEPNVLVLPGLRFRSGASVDAGEKAGPTVDAGEVGGESVESLSGAVHPKVASKLNGTNFDIDIGAILFSGMGSSRETPVRRFR
jgi:hypothetical protein